MSNNITNNMLSVVVLAAGKGTRMFSDYPKMLHKIAGKPIIKYIIDTVMKLGAKEIYVVYGYGGDLLKSILKEDNINWIFQNEPLGTGHAIKIAASSFKNNEDILILYGDVPLININTLIRLKNSKPYGGISLLTSKIDDPTGYGRVIRENGKVKNIIEHKDSTEEYLKIKEINTGILIANSIDIKRWLTKLTNNNAQKEYYITDIVSLAYQEGREIITINPTHISEIEGINNCLQLSRLERNYQIKQAEKLLLNGLIISDPLRFDLRGTLKHGRDVEIDINVILKGNVILGNRVKIGAGCIIKNSVIGDDCKIRPYSILEDAHLQNACTVGPFAHLRSRTELLERAHVGNFVEIKESCLGRKSKAGHLSYLGDAKIGDNVNIGAGTITCNYDGIKKFKTNINDNVFIGSDTQLIAPINIGKGATIAAGTTVTCNVADNELVLSRVPQVHKKGWKR